MEFKRIKLLCEEKCYEAFAKAVGHAAESADEGRSIAAQRGGEFRCSAEDSANKGHRRAPVNHRDDHQRSVKEYST